MKVVHILVSGYLIQVHSLPKPKNLSRAYYINDDLEAMIKSIIKPLGLVMVILLSNEAMLPAFVFLEYILFVGFLRPRPVMQYTFILSATVGGVPLAAS